MTGLRLSFPDFLVVAGYFVIVLWIGFAFRSKLANTRDYFAGGNAIPWWLAGISHYMSSFSAFSFIAYAQMAYTHGFVAVTLFWAAVPGCVAGAWFFARRWRRARIITPVEFLESRFNPAVRQVFAWAGIPMKVFDDALKVFATGLFVSVAAGVNLHAAIVVCGAVTVVYTFLGGVWALVVTDYVQFLMKALAILLLFPMAVVSSGGWGRAFADLPEGFLRLNSGPHGWLYIAGFFVTMLISYNASWSLAQKYYSVRDEPEAAKAAWFAAALNFAGGPIMIAPAIAARNLLPGLIEQGRTADVYVLLVLKLLPVGMVGIIMAAMFSATMAVVSADFNAIASVLTKDVYQRLFRPAATEGELLSAGRAATLALGAATTLLSVWIALSQQQSLFALMAAVLGAFMAPTFLPLLAGLVWRKLNRQGALLGFSLGLLTGISSLALKTWWLPGHLHGNPFHSSFEFEGISFLANAGATILGMLAGTWLCSRGEARSAALNEFFANLDRPIAAEEVPTSSGNPAAPVLGFSTIAVGAMLAAAGLLSGSWTARAIDLTTAALLIGIGLLFRRQASHKEAAS